MRELHGEDWCVHYWSDLELLLLIAHAFPSFQATYLSLPTGVMRADMARYAILGKHGGWYTDTDVRVCPVQPVRVCPAQPQPQLQLHI